MPRRIAAGRQVRPYRAAGLPGPVCLLDDLAALERWLLIQTDARVDGFVKSMDLRQLRYFAVLAEELHFRRAAERLGITQGPLSVAIQVLEQQLGAALFHRTQRRVELSKIGHAFRRHAVGIIESTDRAAVEIRGMVTGDAGELRIGFTAATSLLPFFTTLVYGFRAKFPGVAVTLTEDSSVGQIASLQARAIDVGLLRRPQSRTPSDISFTRLMRERLVVAMHAGHRLGTQQDLWIRELKDERFIFYPRQLGAGIYDQFMGLCHKRSFTPAIVQEARDSATIIGLAATGLGIAIVPAGLQRISIPNILFRPLADEDATTEILLAFRAGEGDAVAGRFIRMAQEAVVSGESRRKSPPNPKPW